MDVFGTELEEAIDEDEVFRVLRFLMFERMSFRRDLDKFFI